MEFWRSPAISLNYSYTFNNKVLLAAQDKQFFVSLIITFVSLNMPWAKIEKIYFFSNDFGDKNNTKWIINRNLKKQKERKNR